MKNWLKKLNKESLARVYYVPALIIALFFVISSASMLGKTPTSDESSHLTRGRIYLDTFDPRINQHNPPLFNAIQALPTYLDSDLETIDFNDVGNDWQFADKNRLKDNFIEINGGKERFASEVLRLPRLWMVTLMSGFLAFYYTVIRKEFSYSAAVISTVLLGLSPTLLGHSRNITTGMPVMAAIFIASWTLYKLSRANSTKRIKWYWLFVLASTFAIQVKFTATLVSVIWIALLWVVDYLSLSKEVEKLNWKSRLYAALKAMKWPIITVLVWFGILAAIYGFQFATLEDMTYGAPWRQSRNPELLQDFGNSLNSILPFDFYDDALNKLYYDIPLPFPQYINGFFENVLIHNFEWYGKFYMGEFYSPDKRIPEYFLVAYAVKETAVTVFATILSFAFIIGSLFNEKFRKVYEKSFRKYYVLYGVGAFIVLLLYSSSINLGIRHVMPFYPYLFLIVGLVLSYLIRFKAKLVLPLYALAFVYMLSSIMYYFPDYISYYNELVGGPIQGAEYVRGTNIDWGQNDGFVNQYLKNPRATKDAFELPKEEKGLLVVNILRFAKHRDGDELDQLHEMYRNGEIEPVDHIHYTDLVFEVSKSDIGIE